MANVSEWSANELENLYLDDMNLSDERGRRAAKIMAAVKAKEDEQDARLDAVAGGLVFRGTKATYADLEAVEDPVVGDMYSVTALGGENYAWDGEAWDSLGTSDANVVHKTGNETIDGTKTFRKGVFFEETNLSRTTSDGALTLRGGEDDTNSRVVVAGKNHPAVPGYVRIYAKTGDTSTLFEARPDGTLTWGGQEVQTTSDERLKTPLSSVPDEILDAWGAVRWGQFQFLSAIDCKGEAARLHLGLIAQRVKAVFEERGLDACEYGILCHDAHAESDGTPATDMWMVRYTEALAMEAAYQRRRADRLESRIEALEARLDGND